MTTSTANLNRIDRADLEALKRQTDLRAEVERELGRPAMHNRDYSKWLCPFHPEQTASFTVWQGSYHCFGCGEHGDLITWVQRREDVGFLEALKRQGVKAKGRTRKVGTMPSTPSPAHRESILDALIPKAPSREWQDAAWQIVAECEASLWDASTTSPLSLKARQWLARRGLREEILRAYRVGYNPHDREMHGLWVFGGIIVPSVHDATSTIYRLKVRRPQGHPKYTQVKGSLPTLYGLDTIHEKTYAFVCEGEFDALLLLQTIGAMPAEVQERVGVITFGTAQQRQITPWLIHLLAPSRYLITMDNDPAGEQATEFWLKATRRARRFGVPIGFKDLTEWWQSTGGGDGALRTWVYAALHTYPVSR